MARINFDDDVESKHEYKKLLKSLGGDDWKALGACVSLFRLCQKYYAKDFPLTEEIIRANDLWIMVETGWLVPCKTYEKAFQVENPEKHFAWYKQKIAAARKGGEATQTIWKAARPSPPGPLSLAPALANKDKSEKVINTVDKKDPVRAASEILKAASDYGRSGSIQARQHLGEDLWEVVKSFGGWVNICNSENPIAIRAQLRECAKALL